MLNPVLNSPLKNQLFRSLLALGLLFAVSSPALAQDAPETPAEEEEPATPMTPEEKQKAATALFTEGKALAAEKDYAGAIEKFEGAFALFPDPGLKFLIGEALQLDGTETRDFEKLQKAVDAYKEYVELVPEGAGVDKANERISQLEESIQAEQDRKDRLADEKAQAELDKRKEEERKRKEEERKLREQKEMQVVLSGGAMFGSDQQLSGILRMSGGALLSWEKYAVEARVGIDAFLRVDQEQGTAATSLTLIDLGGRYGLNYRYIGPFFTGGVGFGVFRAKPSERTILDDPTSCAPANDCTFNIDKNFSGRLGFGYGFRSSEKSTVALRIDVQGWWFSVDDEQEIGYPSPAQIEKPQTSFAIMAGLEFLRWL